MEVEGGGVGRGKSDLEIGLEGVAADGTNTSDGEAGAREPCRSNMLPPPVEFKRKRVSKPDGEGSQCAQSGTAAPDVSSDAAKLPTRGTAAATSKSCRPGKKGKRGRGNAVEQAPQPILKDGHMAWEVEAVLKKKGGTVLVQWVGFGAGEATWEPIANIPEHFIHCYRGRIGSTTRRGR